MRNIILLCLLFQRLLSAESEDPFFHFPPRGFIWYDEIDPPKEREKQIEEESTPEQRNKKMGRDFELALHQALDKPNLPNVQKALQLQNKLFDRSEEFAKYWMLAAMLESRLSHQDSTNTLHRKIHLEEKKQREDASLKTISKDWGLFFYVIADCKYCSAFAPIVNTFAEDHGFQVLALSEKGEDYGPFRGIPDQGVMAYLNPDHFAPMLYLIRKDGQRIYPIAEGITDADRIRENILLIDELHPDGEDKKI